MTQKIFATRAGGRGGREDFVDLAVDQVVLVREHARVHAAAVASGLKKTAIEVAIAYEGRCVGAGEATRPGAGALLAHGVLLARAGAGFPAPVHLERFASPARLCVTDEPRLAGVGGIGMLSLVVPAAALAAALVRGTVTVRTPVSIQIQLAGKLRPFVCAIDAALELLRRGLADVVRRVETSRGAPVVLEFAGPSARSLSVAERSVLAGVAPMVGAAGALFVSDERTEVFLRDQRRSKAHRVLAPDAGAPCEEVVGVDLGAVDPLVLDGGGEVLAVRDLRAQPVSQVLLGGDRGVTLRDLFAAATLLKSKRVPPGLDLLLAVPSRQMLEVLSRAGALTDLIATGARLVEPDVGVTTGELYSPPRLGVALRSADLEPFVQVAASPPATSFVASAETLAYAVATGQVGDPRSFKRPVRVTVPRTLPTDDVLVARKGGRAESESMVDGTRAVRGVAPWQGPLGLAVVRFDAQVPRAAAALPATPAASGVAVWCDTLQEVRSAAARAVDAAGSASASAVRAVMASYIPSPLVTLLSSVGVLALTVDPGATTSESLARVPRIVLPAPSHWIEGQPTAVEVGARSVPMMWLAVGPERNWLQGGPQGGAPVARRPVPGPSVVSVTRDLVRARVNSP